MNIEDAVAATAKPFAAYLRTYFRETFDAIAARFDGVEKRLAEVPAGENGADGKDGDVGPQGERGADGKDGAPGIGEQGPIGERGSDGKDGLRGEPGIAGKDGAPGTDGQRGAPGEKGIDGTAGDNGRDGRDGTPGEPGRDALEIDVRDGIDEGKSYARGTFATYRGGLIRSLRTTDPVTDGLAKAGWQVVLDGIASIDRVADADDPRKLDVVVLRSSGARQTISTYLPAMRYRGVFREGDEYALGDTATWAGSLWHCDAPTSDKPGEPGSKGWTLAAKRGRDGKDGSDARAPRVIQPVKL